MDRINITDATPAQLRDFGASVLGLELTGRETHAMMVSKLAEVGYGVETITLTPPLVIPSGNPKPDEPFTTRMRDDGIKEVRIIVQVQDKDGGDRPVPVSVNGRAMIIPRGKPVWVPESYVEVLNHAVEYVYPEYVGQTDSMGGLAQPRQVKSYPFSYA